MQPDRKNIRIAAAAAGLAAFVLIAYFVITRDVLTFDTVIREYLYSIRTGGLTVILTALTYLGNWETISTLCVVFLVLPQTRFRFGLPLSGAAIIASLVQKILKLSFHRARPDLALHLISQGGYSFPSGHSFTVLIYYGMLLWLCRKYIRNRTAANLITAFFICLITVIGFSRIYLGVHYPTDVLGGWSMGLCLLMILTSCVEYLRRGRDSEGGDI